MDGLTIRHVTETDLPLMEEAFGLWKFRFNNERALAEHRAGRLTWLIGDLEGAPVASVWGELFPEHDRSGQTIHIVAFRVHESIQRLGVGSTMLDAIEREGIARGRSSSTLFVAQDNAPALGLYKKAGYQIVDVRFARWEFDDPAGRRHLLTEEQFVMVKTLLATAAGSV